MKSLQSKFKSVQRKNPGLGDYPCLMEAVSGQKFNRATIRSWFNKLVPKEDYDLKDSNTLVFQLHLASNRTEEVEFEDEITPGEVLTDYPIPTYIPFKISSRDTQNCIY